MPLSRRSLALPADPAAVRLARSWVGDILTEVGRAELVPGAKLAVSELVTNAILHATPPLTVRLRGTREHPRVEVSDGSPRALRQVELPDGGEDAITTFGRGLSLVAVNSSLWGWDRDADGVGKTVWFEPVAEMHDRVDLAAISSEAEPLDRDAAEPPALDGGFRVELRNMPAQLFGHLRRYHFELRRELRLLAFSDPERYPLAVRVTETFARGDAERSATRGIEALDAAIARGEASVDLVYEVPAETPATMADILELLAQVREEFADEQLLAVTPREELLALQTWYFREFVRQGRGEEPRSWRPPDQEPGATDS